jgi:transposase-like protein
MEIKGNTIAQTTGDVRRIDEHTYTVKSKSARGECYDIIAGELGWLCSCPHHVYMGQKCKHIFAIEFSLKIQKTVVADVSKRIEPISNTDTCMFCKSYSVVKFGIRHNESGDIQKYRCNDCKHYFTINLGFEKRHATPQVITSAMQLYFTDESLRNVQKFLRL